MTCGSVEVNEFVCTLILHVIFSFCKYTYVVYSLANGENKICMTVCTEMMLHVYRTMNIII